MIVEVALAAPFLDFRAEALRVARDRIDDGGWDDVIVQIDVAHVRFTSSVRHDAA
ncbi:hypothetical protein D3C83_171790 [compost metagenome]